MKGEKHKNQYESAWEKYVCIAQNIERLLKDFELVPSFCKTRIIEGVCKT